MLMFMFARSLSRSRDHTHDHQHYWYSTVGILETREGLHILLRREFPVYECERARARESPVLLLRESPVREGIRYEPSGRAAPLEDPGRETESDLTCACTAQSQPMLATER